MASPNFVNQDRRADDIVSIPKFLPKVCKGQVFLSCFSDKPIDDEHAVGPDDNLLRRSHAKMEGDDRRKEFSPGNGLSFSM